LPAAVEPLFAPLQGAGRILVLTNDLPNARHDLCNILVPKATTLVNLEDHMADEANGKLRHLGGKIKEGVGDLLGDRKLEQEGELDQIEGRAEQDEVRAAEAAREANARRQAARIAKGEPPTP
jgi:uncharacterized protein YjbJ (UPF0337 family)